MVKKMDMNVRLLNAARASRKLMQPFCETMAKIAKLCAGPYYGPKCEGEKARPINLLALYQAIVPRSLMPTEPRFQLSTFERDQEKEVLANQEWLNDELKTIDFSWSVRECIESALSYLGVMKIGIATPAQSHITGWDLEIGDVYIEPISFHDLILDMSAKRFSEMGYCGHIYRAVKEEIVYNRMYNAKARGLLKEEDAPLRATAPEGFKTLQSIGLGGYEIDTNYEEMVDLVEIHCYRSRTSKTFTLSDFLFTPEEKLEPLMEAPYVGHPRGPYRFLGFGRVPDNLIPIGPMAHQIDADDSANMAYRKLTSQAAMLKKLIAARKGNPEDAARVEKATDGKIVMLDRPEDFKPIEMGGPDPALQMFSRQSLDVHNMIAGNLRLIGGLSASAPTATQESMMQQQSSGQVTWMRETVGYFAQQCVEAANWLWWNHPEKIMRSKYELPGFSEFWMTRELKPWNAPNEMNRAGQVREPLRRGGPMPKIKIDMYSVAHSSPDQKAEFLLGLLTKVLVPMAPVLQQQQISVDMNEALKIISEYKDLPELKRILKLLDIQPEVEGDIGGGPQVETERNYNYARSDVGRNTQQQQGAEQMTMLQGMAGEMNG